jgi:protein-tyrosine kinase
MSSLIEQASRRLEQLRQAGAVMPDEVRVGDVPPAIVRPVVPEPAVVAAPPKPVVNSRQITLDLDAMVAAGLVSPNAPRSHIADQYRVIKRPLIANAMGKGATPVANGNLIIATELDNTVMLVDADVARPSILRMLGLPAGRGLLDLLVDDKVELHDVLLRTNIDKLTLLPSGTPHTRATELLASDAMTLFIEDIAKRYSDRIVIFDSPPLLLTTESRVLASHMGQIVIVVHAEKTLQSDVQHALSTIESCPVKLLVLNQAKAAAVGGYGYGYGQGYGYGYGQ